MPPLYIQSFNLPSVVLGRQVYEQNFIYQLLDEYLGSSLVLGWSFFTEYLTT